MTDRAGTRPDEPSGPALELRRRAIAAAATAYSAAHGHPTEAAARGRIRWAVSRRAATAAVLALAVLGGVVALRTLPDEPAVLVEIDPRPAPGGTANAVEPVGTQEPRPTSTAATIVVHVVGEVTAPGVVQLPAGSRVTDAVEAAGGPTTGADLGALNLARTLADGEQVRVPAPGEAPVAAAGAAAPGPGPVDLNAATVADLDALPGIGPVLAERIVTWRTANGRFTRVAELAEVAGIGPAVLADLESLVVVAG